MGAIIKRNNIDFLNLVERGKHTITSASLSQGMLTDDTVKFSVSANSKLDIKINDTVEVFGNTYRINALPTFRKISNTSYSYEIEAQGLMYDLLRCKFFNADATGFKTTTNFPLIGNLEVFLTAIKNNMSRFSTLWEIGTVASTETKMITFGDDTCLSALQKICQEFKTDFWVKSEGGKYKIHTGEFGSTLPIDFEYGKGKGLYSLSRENIDDNGIVNRLYVNGGSNNIPAGYRNFSDNLKFSDVGYLEDTALIAEIGLKEGSINFDEIYPRRTGKITALGSTKFKFKDSTMDFDLNEKNTDGSTKYLIAGTTAKIHFNTGNLAGYEFEIKKGGYNTATKEFEIIPFKNESGQKFPDEVSTAFQFSVNDEYVLLDIVMPQTYITNAENELLAKGTEQFNLSKTAKVSYNLDIDPEYIKTFSAPISIGDYIRVKDSALGIDKVIRVQNITRNFITDSKPTPYNFIIKLADSTEIDYNSQMILDIKDIKNIVNIINLGNINLSQLGYKTTEELRNLAFDPDGYFDMSNIRFGSIDVGMLSSGAQSQQLSCSVVFSVNDGGIANKISSKAGILFSQTLNKSWNIPALSTTFPDNNFRYVYAKCSKVGSSGSVFYTQSQIKFDEDPNDYYFLLGILHTVEQGVRVLSITIGTTTINGGLIRTGIISSLDGLTTFNLDTGEFKGKFTFSNGTNVQTAVENAQNTANGAVKTVDVEYYLSNSATVLSGGDWVTIAPAWVNGKYMWSRTKTTLVNGNTTYTPSENGVCIAGAEGTSGVGISSITERYLATDLASGVTVSTSGWTTTIQTISPTKKYLWNYKTTTYTNGSTSQTNPVIIGTYGDKGADGVKGADGANGQPTYTWIRYADTPTTGISNIPTNKAYIGLAYNKLTAVESNNYADYKWSLIKGTDGVRGADGANGQPTYTWIKYSDVSDGSNPYDLPTANTLYIGISPNKLTPTKSTNKADYTWSKFKGDDGVGIESIVEYYLASASPSGVTINTSGWTSTVQTIDTTKKYLWNYTKTTYTNGLVENTTPVLIGTMGTNGTNGQGITSITENYYLSTSKTMQLGGEWSNTPPIWVPNMYLWTRSTIVWNNPTSTTTTPPIVDSSWEAINGMQIGGRNLIKNSKVVSFSGADNYAFSEVKLFDDYFEIKGYAGVLWNRYTEFNLTERPSGLFTVSFDFMTTDVAGDVSALFTLYPLDKYIEIPNTFNKWQRFSITADMGVFTGAVVFVFSKIAESGSVFRIKNWKLEKGNKATDWTPAPEDVDASIANAQSTATNAQNAINTTNQTVANLSGYVDGAFQDGIIEASEAIAIEKYINQIKAEKANLDGIYNTLYANSLLTGTPKSNLSSAKTTFDTSFDNLINSINTAIADGKTTIFEKADVDAKFVLYRNAIQTLQQRIEEANGSIQALINSNANTANQNAQTAILQAQNAQTTAAATANVVSFLETTANGNVFSTGTLQVGSATGANAGITGVVDRDGKSVRFWAGSTYANKNKANWLVRDDGVEEKWFNGVLIYQEGVINGAYCETSYNLDGQIGKRKTFSPDGKILEEWYNNGVLVYHIGQDGIYNVAEIPESFNYKGLVNCNINLIQSNLEFLEAPLRQMMYQKATDPRRFELRANKNSYLYNAGQNVYSEGNKQYEGFKNTKSKTDTVANGWYAYEILGFMLDDGIDSTRRFANVFRTENGKIVQSGIVTIETNGYTFNQF